MLKLRKRWLLGNISVNEIIINMIILDFVFVKVNFSIIIIIIGCRIWDNDNNLWIMDGCIVKILIEILFYVMFDWISDERLYEIYEIVIINKWNSVKCIFNLYNFCLVY